MLDPTISLALSNWLIGNGPLELQAHPATWLSLHGEATPDASNQLNGWSAGNRLKVLPEDWTQPLSLPSGAVVVSNRTSLLMGQHLQDRTIYSWALWDAAQGGRMLINGRFAPVMQAAGGVALAFHPGGLSFSVA